MKVFLAGTCSRPYIDVLKSLYVLESFYYIKEWQIPYIKKWDMFLLDSGAFTFLNNTNASVNWDDYLSRYIEFINDNDVDYFFELDIDSVVGRDKVKKIRNILESRTSKRCIPVWHRSRGLEEYKAMCRDYNYIAIGGIVTKEIKSDDYYVLPKLVDIAHANGCRVHGLGFTSMSWASKVKFDSVDSTTWLSGARYGHVYLFKNGNISSRAPKGERGVSYKVLDPFNFNEWCKFQRYAQIHY